MSAMSASPVKPPVLPPSGVNVTPPVATSPPKGGIMPIPATLTIAPAKPPNMMHSAKPLSLIADNKCVPQHPSQSQTGVPPAIQPIPPSLHRAPEKPKELPASIGLPAGLPVKPTSNGMEGLPPPTAPLPTSTPALPEAQVSAAPPFKMDQQSVIPDITEIPDSKPTLPENASENLAPPLSPPIENVAEKKEDVAILKPVDPPVPETAKVSCVPTPQQPDNTPAVTTVSAPAPVSVPAPTPAAGPVPLTTTTPATPASPVVTPQSAPPVEQPSVTPTVSRTDTSIPHTKPELKVATIPRQAAKRKREPKAAPPSPEVKKEGKDDDRKSKRVRLPTQPYQSPLPELNIIAKINKSTKSTPSKAADDKLIVFYKNEFLAVRNAEGGFYVCQAMQNIYKSSPRIRIRWLSQEGGKDTYSPDFYDHTDFDCILTNLNLDKVEKEKFRLPLVEQQRTESILKRALDVEKGVSEKPPVTEEHPDGLDLSLFRDESQLKKSKSRSRNSSTGNKSDSDKSDDGDSSEEVDEEEEEEEEEKEKKAKKETPSKTSKKKKKSVKKKPPAEKKSAAKSSNNKSTVQAAKKKTDTRVGSKRKSPVSSNSQPAEKRSRTSSQPSDRTNKTRSVEATAGVKSQRERRAKSRK